MDIQPRNRGVEIGGTWYGLAYQRTAANTECKYLLPHPSEVWGCIRVQLKTDLRNERSHRGHRADRAVHEGILRNHMIRPDGTIRDTVYYSIIDREWPAVKARLEAMLESNRNAWTKPNRSRQGAKIAK